MMLGLRSKIENFVLDYSGPLNNTGGLGQDPPCS